MKFKNLFKRVKSYLPGVGTYEMRKKYYPKEYKASKKLGGK